MQRVVRNSISLLGMLAVSCTVQAAPRGNARALHHVAVPGGKALSPYNLPIAVKG